MTRRIAALVLAASVGAIAPAAAQCIAGGPPCGTIIASARHDSAAAVFARGAQSLRATGVDRFAASHPAWDGRGVLIAILDSGIDPGIPGLGISSDGTSKLLDLRDFSGEGHVPLERATRRGDTLIVGHRRLLGAAAVAAASGDTPIWAGLVREAAIGTAPEADLNGNGVATDTFVVVVVHAASGWAVYVDAAGTGSLAGGHPVRDFAVGHEFFGWHTRGPNGQLLPSPVDLAVNLADSAGVPTLDLFFDTSSHGTHVTGIAAGHDIYGVSGFDGIAPGASVIGLKIADDADGAVSTTGSMLRALDYAITFAHQRAMPLVVNLSFGVGNEIEGSARIDALVDSVLAAHPDVVMTVAAGNDGPGLSTIGFPGSAARVISVGATLPLSFMGAPPGTSVPDPVAPFSSRGGEEAGPDLVVPGAAYSTVPNYAIGDEQEEGTSMASPYAAGLAARLVSALHASNRTVSSAVIRQVLRASAHPIDGSSAQDDGAGVPDIVRAWDRLAAAHDVAELAVDVGAVHGRGGVYVTATSTLPIAVHVGIRRLGGASLPSITLHASAPWIQVPELVPLRDDRGEFTVQIAAGDGSARTQLGAITVTNGDDSDAPLALIPVTLRVPIPVAGPHPPVIVSAPAGGVARMMVAADSGRGLQIEIATTQRDMHATASLHEPGGMPFRDGQTLAAGFAEGEALFDIGANDVENGIYEIDLVADPLAPANARITTRVSPLRLGVSVTGDTLHALAKNLGTVPLNVRLRAGLIGADRSTRVSGDGTGAVRLVLPVPAWGVHAILDTRMTRADWSRFTDFGVSFLDRAGRHIESHPINYAFGRASFDVPAPLRGDSVVVEFRPGFADPAGDQKWEMSVDVRYYVDKPYSLDGGGSPVRPVAGGALREERFAQSALPINIPAGFVPLVTIVALEGEDHTWARELTIPRPAGTAP